MGENSEPPSPRGRVCRGCSQHAVAVRQHSSTGAVHRPLQTTHTHTTDPHAVSSALPSHTRRTQRAVSAKTKKSSSLGAKCMNRPFPFRETITIIQRRQLVSITTLKCTQHKVWTDKEESTMGCHVCEADSEQQGSYAPSFTLSLCLAGCT